MTVTATPTGRSVRRSVCAALALGLAAAWAGNARAAGGPHRYLDRPDAWFKGEEAARVAANILSFQSDLGGWPKNVDTTAAPYAGDRKDLKPTFDNDATTDELRELLWVKGWGNRDVAAFLHISEQQVANYRFAAVKKLTEAIRTAGLSADVFPELYQADGETETDV